MINKSIGKLTKKEKAANYALSINEEETLVKDSNAEYKLLTSTDTARIYGRSAETWKKLFESRAIRVVRFDETGFLYSCRKWIEEYLEEVSQKREKEAEKIPMRPVLTGESVARETRKMFFGLK